MKPIYLSCIAMLLLLFSQAASSQAEQLRDNNAISLNIQTSDGMRQLIVKAPHSIPSKAQIVLIAHGGGGSAKSMLKKSQKLTRELNDNGFIAVFMDGTAKRKKGRSKTWNADHCCSHAQANQINEVGYYNAAIEKLNRTFPVDNNQIFLMGHSNGAMLSYRIAGKLNIKPRGVIAISGAMFADQPDIPKRTSLFIMHTDNDKVINIDGSGKDRSERHRTAPNLSFSETEATLLSNKHCMPASSNSKKLSITHTHYDCRFNANIDVVRSSTGGHKWPKKIRNYSVETAIVDFLLDNR